MAARENQGLQIALIIFVILTIILIVSTYMSFRAYSDHRDKANALQTQNSDKDRDMRAAIEEAAAFRALITSAQDEALDAVKEAAGNELQAHGDGLPEAERNYRGLVARLSSTLRKAEATNAEQAAKIQELESKLATNTEAAKAEASEYSKKLGQTANDLQQEREAFGQAREQITAQKEKQAADFSAARKQDVVEVQKSREQMAAISTQLARTDKLLEDLRNKESREEKANEYPDGKITRVSQRSRKVWLNVGQADGLRQQTSFVIVAPEKGNPIATEPKGRIEVVRVTGAHQAEANIVDDDLSDPIMPGDNIFSVVWEAGRPEHFALAGRMDIDGDGESDRELVRDLISLNGGVIDAEVTEDGQRTGQMSVHTKFLVFGDRPGADSKDLQGYSEIYKEAEELGVKSINAPEFVRYLGYKPQRRAVALGRDAKPTDFKARLPGGVQRVMPGSEKVQDIRPPRGRIRLSN